MIWYEREWSQWAQMIASDPKMIPRWSQMILSDPKVITSNWFRTIPDHRSWANMRPDGPEDPRWSWMMPFDPKWARMIPGDSKWSQMIQAIQWARALNCLRCAQTITDAPERAQMMLMWSEMVPGMLVRDLLVLTIPAALSWSNYSVWPSRRHVLGNFGPCGSLKWSRAKKLLKNYSKTTTPKLL